MIFIIDEVITSLLSLVTGGSYDARAVDGPTVV